MSGGLMEGKKLLALLCVLWSVFCLTECVRRNGTRRQRRESCPEGLYTTRSGLQCCRCPKGYYLKSDCTSTQSAPECTACEPGTYMDHANNETKCELCKKCGHNDNKVVEQRCPATSNTVCRCQDGHYCDKGDECKVCYICSTCEEFGIKVPCTLTNDTQCNEKAPKGPEIITAISVLIVIIIIIVLTAVYFLRKKLCFKPPEREGHTSLELLDPDLKELLPRIAEILGFQVVRKVVRRQGVLSNTAIDNIMFENHGDTGEQAYRLLDAWYEKHGKRGASKALCENLTGLGKRSKAEEVHQLIREGLSNREVQRNGEL